jgi:hypothetical protein
MGGEKNLPKSKKELKLLLEWRVVYHGIQIGCSPVSSTVACHLVTPSEVLLGE